MNGLQPFGARTWADVQAAITKRVTRKWFFDNVGEREDAIADAMVALVQDWPDFPSTQKALAEGDARKLFNYAVKYGELRALTLLGERHKASVSVVHIVDNEELASDYSHTIAVERVYDITDARSDEEREDEMLAQLLDKHGVDGLEAYLEVLAPTPAQ